MMLKMRTLLLTILFVPFFAIAQAPCLDTIALADCKANYPIIGTTADLQFVPKVRKWHYCYNVKNQRYPTSRLTDTIFYYCANQIFGDDYEISYLENYGKIRLEYILLKKHKKFKMNVGGFSWSNGLTLQYKTSLNEVLKHFNNDTTRLTLEGGYGPLLMGTKFKTMWHVTSVFYTGEPCHTQMSLTFNKRKELIIIEIDYFEQEHLKVGSYFKDSVF